MVRKQNKKIRALWMALLFLVVFAGATALAYLIKSPNGLFSKHVAQAPIIKPVEKPHVDVAVKKTQDIIIFVPEVIKREGLLVEQTIQVDATDKPVEAALNELFKYRDLIPEGTSLLSPVTKKGKIATVNLSKEFVDNFTGGSNEEALTINAIAQTVIKNSDKITSVIFLVEGKSIESLGGHFELNDPVIPEPEMFRSR